MITVTRGDPLLRLLLIVLTALYGVALVDSAPASIRPLRNRVNLLQAVKMSQKFSCKEPQARAYHLEDLIANLMVSSDEKVNQPPYIVAKRCDGHSGCCGSLEMACSPNVTYHEDIEIEIWSFANNKTRRQWITLEQHRTCSCELMDLSGRQRLEAQKPKVTLLR